MQNLKNGQLVWVPLLNSLLRKVDHSNIDLGAFQGYDGTRRSTDISSSYAADIRHFHNFCFGHLKPKHQKISSQNQMSQ